VIQKAQEMPPENKKNVMNKRGSHMLLPVVVSILQHTKRHQSTSLTAKNLACSAYLILFILFLF